MTNCPLCESKLLAHIRDQHLYWFCRHCWQEIPNLADQVQERRQSNLKERPRHQTHPQIPRLPLQFPKAIGLGIIASWG